MTDFFYIAVDKTGKASRGNLSSGSADELRKTLNIRGLELISYTKQSGGNKFSFDLDIVEMIKRLLHRRITAMEKISFASHLSVMLKAGVPIIEAVGILSDETTSFQFGTIIKELTMKLEKGQTLSSYLEKEKVFSPAHLAILKSGEASGKITESLLIIAKDLKRDYLLKKKLTGAMIYPAVILVALLGISIFIITFVLPKIAGVFKQMNIVMPLPTKILLAVGLFLANNYLALIFALIILTVLFLVVLRFIPIDWRFLNSLVASLPLIKKILYQMSMARFIRSLSSLLFAGVPISEALAISGEVFLSRRMRELVIKISQDIRKGVSLSESFRSHQKKFGSLLTKMASVGEKSGRLAEILEELATFYEEEVEGQLENFATVIEPLMMLLVGIGVGGMILSIIAPIYQMMGKLTP